MGRGKEGKRTGVQLGWDTVWGLQEEDDGVSVSFWMMDSGEVRRGSAHSARGLRFDFAGTRRLSAPGGHLVGPGDILPTGS